MCHNWPHLSNMREEISKLRNCRIERESFEGMATKWGQPFRLTPSLPTRPEATGILRTALDHPTYLVLRYRAIREGAPEILQIARRRWQNTETVLSPTARTVSGALSRMMGLPILSDVKVGHHGFEGHRGPTRVMVACSLMTFARRLLIMPSGGKHQGFSRCSGTVSPSTNAACGSGRHAAYRGIWLLSRLAKRSMLWGPHCLSTALKMAGLILKSDLSLCHLESRSARWLSRPGRCTACTWNPCL